MRDHGIVLAAGTSRRMGREKARLPWLEGRPLLRWMTETLAAAGWQPHAVVGPSQFDFWRAELPGGCVVLNSDPARGKASSLAAGARSVPQDARRLLVIAVDQPRPRELLQQLRTEPGAILVPDFEGRRGHPVALEGSFRDELLALDESSQGLRGWLDAHRTQTRSLPGWDAAWLRWDLNTPADYEAALAFFETTITPRRVG